MVDDLAPLAVLKARVFFCISFLTFPRLLSRLHTCVCALVIYKCRCGDKTRRAAACMRRGEKLATKEAAGAEIEPGGRKNMKIHVVARG